MITNNKLKSALIVTAISATLTVAAQITNLPILTIQGKEYYCYKVKKGDSVYGVCKTYGWDESLLRKCNTGLNKKMTKGQTIYYPVSGKPIAQTQTKTPKKFKVDVTTQSVKHIVNRGENIYTIAKYYNTSVDAIYASNPNARHGIKQGDSLIIAQPKYDNNSTSEKPIFYTVRHGETLYSIAEDYNTTVAQLLEENPAISEQNFKSGITLRLIPNSRPSEMVTKTEEVNSVIAFKPYKIKKNDSWESIAKTNGITVKDVQAANDNNILPKKGEWIVVPETERKTITTVVEVLDSISPNQHSQKEVYKQVHNITQRGNVNLSIITGEPSSNSNIDFLRGFLIALDEMKNSDIKVNMTVLDASAKNFNIATDSTLNTSNIIIGLYNDNFPQELSTLGCRTGAEIVNVFDTKSDLYETNHSTIQFLQPGDYFNEVIATDIYNEAAGRKLLMIGEIDNTDILADAIAAKFPSGDIAKLSLEEFLEFPFSPTDKYLVYCYAEKKEDINNTLDAISKVKENQFDIVTIGRPVWVAYMQTLNEKFGALEVQIPSRFYCNPEDEQVKNFSKSFKEQFDRSPIKSYPQYALLGYDVANYFIPITANNGGDFNTGVYERNGIQNDINIQRINNWGGFINANAYILKCLPENIVERKSIK